MKKVKLILFTLLSCLLFSGTAYAATANIKVSATASQVIIGNNVTVYVTISSASPLGAWEYGLNYNSSVFRLVSSSDGLHVAGYVGNNTTKSMTFTYTFTAVAKGSSTFSVGSANVVGFDESIMTLNPSSVTVNTITYNEYQDSLSKNNNLASLKVDGADLEPKFNRDTLEYNVKVSEDTKEINIAATPEDSTASVSGIGPQSVSPGNNTFEIYVVAQNGSEKVYKINVEVIDKNPIEVEYQNKKYTVVKIRDNLVAPKGFKESTINIEEFEIPAYRSDIMDVVVIGLKDEDGKIVMFTYEDGKYDKYLEINLGNITIRPLEMKEKLDDYTLSSLKINNIEVECLQKTNEDRYKYVYGVNVETNEEGLYTVDTKDNTIMKFDKEESTEIAEQTKLLLYIASAFAGTTFVSLIVILCLLSKKNKNKEPEKKVSKQNKKEEVQEKTICPKCHQEYDSNEERCPYCALKEEANKQKEDKKLAKTAKISKDNLPSEEEIEKVDEQADEVYDIFEDEHKHKKKKKDKKVK